jgi:hypothetical protein
MYHIYLVSSKTRNQTLISGLLPSSFDWQLECRTRIVLLGKGLIYPN